MLSGGQSGPVDLLSLQSSLGHSLDHMGGEEESKGPKFCPTGILIIRWWVQHCWYWGIVFQEEALHVVSSDVVDVAHHRAIQNTADPLPFLLYSHGRIRVLIISCPISAEPEMEPQ